MTWGEISNKATAFSRKRGGKGTKPGVVDYARGMASVKINKEKQRLKTDPIGTAQRATGAVGKVASKVKGALQAKSGGVGTTGGGNSSDPSVRYQ